MSYPKHTQRFRRSIPELSLLSDGIQSCRRMCSITAFVIRHCYSISGYAWILQSTPKGHDGPPAMTQGWNSGWFFIMCPGWETSNRITCITQGTSSGLALSTYGCLTCNLKQKKVVKWVNYISRKSPDEMWDLHHLPIYSRYHQGPAWGPSKQALFKWQMWTQLEEFT